MKRIVFFGCLVLFLAIAFTACGGAYNDSPLGYDYALTQTAKMQSQSPVAIPTTTGQNVAHLREPGLGTSPASFATKYGKPLPTSQPPTMYIFKAGLDDFPNGSLLVISFDKGAVDDTPRAVQISWIAGDSHATTYNQAQAIAEGFFPDDTGKPGVLQKKDSSPYKCLVKGYQSDTLAKVFPKELFQASDGNVAKEGSIAVSFFPYYSRGTYGEDHTGFVDSNNDKVSSVLITMGTRPYC